MLLINPSVDTHLGCFWVLALLNNAAVTVGIRYYFFFFLSRSEV
jgi:hypothetical protein